MTFSYNMSLRELSWELLETDIVYCALWWQLWSQLVYSLNSCSLILVVWEVMATETLLEIKGGKIWFTREIIIQSPMFYKHTETHSSCPCSQNKWPCLFWIPNNFLSWHFLVPLLFGDKQRLCHLEVKTCHFENIP